MADLTEDQIRVLLEGTTAWAGHGRWSVMASDEKRTVRCMTCGGCGWVGEHAHSPEQMPCPDCMGRGRIHHPEEAWVANNQIVATTGPTLDEQIAAAVSDPKMSPETQQAVEAMMRATYDALVAGRVTTEGEEG